MDPTILVFVKQIEEPGNEAQLAQQANKTLEKVVEAYLLFHHPTPIYLQAHTGTIEKHENV
ncbi:hypothetical protein ACJX0J_024068, partial [Zea mays]